MIELYSTTTAHMLSGLLGLIWVSLIPRLYFCLVMRTNMKVYCMYESMNDASVFFFPGSARICITHCLQVTSDAVCRPAQQS